MKKSKVFTYLTILAICCCTAYKSQAQIEDLKIDSNDIKSNYRLVIDRITTMDSNAIETPAEIVDSVSSEAVLTVEEDSLSGEEQEVKNPCLDLETLRELIYLPIVDAMDVLGERGYQMGANTDTVSDTINYVVLRYLRTAFYNVEVTGAEVDVMESLDGLGNRVEFAMRPREECSPMQELAGGDYVLDKTNSTYVGSTLREGKIQRYAITIQQNKNLWLRCVCLDEQEDYIAARRAEMAAIVGAGIVRAHQLTGTGQYAEALRIVDSLRGYYPPMDDSLAVCAMWVRERRLQFYQSRMDMAVAARMYSRAILLCDTLLGLNPPNREELMRTRVLMTDQLGEVAVPYKELYPKVYDSIRRQLQYLINTEIRTYAEASEQRIELDFHIHTNYENESSAKITLSRSNANRRAMNADGSRRVFLQRKLDSLVASPMITPHKEQGIFVRTDEEIKADVKWNLSTLNINGNKVQDSAMYRLVDTIERQYMYQHKTSKTALNEDGSQMELQVPRLPTKRIYTFEWVNKEVSNGRETVRYRDIKLTGFQTTSLTSWMPSLLVPGLGTTQQEARSEAISRAIPFFLCMGLSVAGFNIDKLVPGKEGEDLKSIGPYIGWGAAGIGAAIYLTEIIEGIGNSFKNLNRSRALRKRLRNGPILIDSQDVVIGD